MTQIIDFRNARYQGQVKNNLPHGIGIIIDQYFLFCLAQWQQGQIVGYCFIVFPDGKVFYGIVNNHQSLGMSTYHLKDQCQIFRNFSKQNSNKQNNIAVLLPTLKMILEVEGQSANDLKIQAQFNYDQKDLSSIRNTISKITNYKFNQKQLQQLLSVQIFLNNNFVLKYKQLLQITYLLGQKNIKQIYVSFRGESLGIKLQICQKQDDLTSIHNDGHTYVIRSLGFFSQQGILTGFGLKTIDTLIKGKVKQEGIYNLPQTIRRYQDNNRPKECTMNISNYFRRSVQFTNVFFDIYYLYSIQEQCINMNFSIKESQTRKHAQIILENPKQLTFQQQKIIQLGRRKLGLSISSRIVKNNKQKTSRFDQEMQKRTKLYQQKQQQQKKSQFLNKVKQEIYRSVSKRKLSGSKTPYKQMIPSQLKVVRPILNMTQNSDEKNLQSNNKKSYSPLKQIQFQNNFKNLFPKHQNNTDSTNTLIYNSNNLNYTSQKQLRSFNDYSSRNQKQYKDQQVSTKTPTRRYNYLDMMDQNYQSNKNENIHSRQFDSNGYKKSQYSYGRQTKVDLQSLTKNKDLRKNQQQIINKTKKYNRYQYDRSPQRVSGTIGRKQFAGEKYYKNQYSPYSEAKFKQNSYQEYTQTQRRKYFLQQREKQKQRILQRNKYQQKMQKDPIYANLDLNKLQLYDIPQQKNEQDSITSTQKQLIQYYNQKNNVQNRNKLLRENEDYLQRRQPKRQHHIYQKNIELNDSLDNKKQNKINKNINITPSKSKTPVKTNPIKQISPMKSKSSANSSYAVNNTFGGSKNNSYGEIDKVINLESEGNSRRINYIPNQRSPLKTGGAIKSNKKGLFTKNQFQ